MSADPPLNDSRLPEAFKLTTFSGFKKSEVAKALVESIAGGKIEEACNWSAELLAAGHLAAVWDRIFTCVATNVRMASPRFIVYVGRRCSAFREAMGVLQLETGLEPRNDATIRQLMAEVVIISCLAPKEPPLVCKPYSARAILDAAVMEAHMKAPSTKFAQPFVREGDSVDVFAGINELACALDSRTGQCAAYFWIDWLLAYSAKRRKDKAPCRVALRDFVRVSGKAAADVVWIIWEVIVGAAQRAPALVAEVVGALLEMFQLRYSQGCKTRRRGLIYLAATAVCGGIHHAPPLVGHQVELETMMKRLPKVYRNIAKAQDGPHDVPNKAERKNTTRNIKLDLVRMADTRVHT